MLALFIGVVLVAVLGLVHHYGIIIIRAPMPRPRNSPQLAILVSFWGLLVLHLLEILLYAAAYQWLLQLDWIGGLGGSFDGSWEGLVYFSGINFATLGYTQIKAEGPIRLINMMQSLGGFMVLTWSATFIYSVCEEAWSR